MKTMIFSLAMAAFAVMGSSNASAMSTVSTPATVPLDVGASTDVTGNFTQFVASAPISDGTGGIFSVIALNAPGTLVGGIFDLNFNGVLFTSVPTDSNGAGVFNQAFAIDGATLLAATSQPGGFSFTLDGNVPVGTSLFGGLFFNTEVVAVPEPTTLALIGIGGIVGCGSLRRRRR